MEKRVEMSRKSGHGTLKKTTCLGIVLLPGVLAARACNPSTMGSKDRWVYVSSRAARAV